MVQDCVSLGKKHKTRYEKQLKQKGMYVVEHLPSEALNSSPEPQQNKISEYLFFGGWY
jgi:hypothetical protein